MNSIVKTGDYNITIGDNALPGITQFLVNASYKGPVFILADENTNDHCIPHLLKAVPDLEQAEIIQVMNGENQKNLYVCMDIISILNDKGANEQSLLINLGGEMICDMGAFVAGTYNGGIDFIHVPTTLVAMTDVSVGERAAINFGELKNHVRFRAKPRAVFVYPGFLDTLDRRQMLSGFAEMLNYAMIADEQFWQKLKSADIDYTKSLTPLIYQAISIKNNIVAAVNGQHMISDAFFFGHMVGNAVESFSREHNKLPLLYGEALAIGMVCEGYISWVKGLITKEKLKEITSLIKNAYPPYVLSSQYDRGLLSIMGYDTPRSVKKSRKFTLLSGIGGYNIHQTVGKDLIKAAIAYYRKEFSNIVAMN